MKPEIKATINGVVYYFDEGYGEHGPCWFFESDVYDETTRKWSYQNSGGRPEVLCGKCKGGTFTLSYGNYELFATCPCGNKMSVYSG